MNTCHVCGAALREKAAYCTACGAYQPELLQDSGAPTVETAAYILRREAEKQNMRRK